MRGLLRKRRIHPAATILAVLLASLVQLMLVQPVAAEAVEKAPSPGLGALEEVEARYSGISSVRMEATFAMTVYPRGDSDAAGEPVIGAGTIQYWAQGDLYRVRTEADASLGILGNLEVAFDGDHFQTFLPNSRILTLKAGDASTLPTLPNPFYLPLDFLSPEADTCPFCKLRLRDLTKPETWSRAEVRHGFAQARAPEAGGAMTAEVPGRELAGQPFFHRIRIGFEEAASRIEAVERLTAAGKPLLTIAIVSRSTFRGPGVRSELPSAIDLFEYDPEKGDLMTKTRFIIRTLELNSPLEAATFEIDPEQAPYIWDEDARFWLKHPEPEFAAAPPR